MVDIRRRPFEVPFIALIDGSFAASLFNEADRPLFPQPILVRRLVASSVLCSTTSSCLVAAAHEGSTLPSCCSIVDTSISSSVPLHSIHLYLLAPPSFALLLRRNSRIPSEFLPQADAFTYRSQCEIQGVGKRRGLKSWKLFLLADFYSCKKLSWGLAVLCYTYHCLCRASDQATTDIAGCTPLMMSWIYQRFPQWCLDERNVVVFPLASRYDFMTHKCLHPIICTTQRWVVRCILEIPLSLRGVKPVHEICSHVSHAKSMVGCRTSPPVVGVIECCSDCLRPVRYDHHPILRNDMLLEVSQEECLRLGRLRLNDGEYDQQYIIIVILCHNYQQNPTIFPI
ncbi:hypothetical protein PIB30_046188 [Stylosanthes scabra]|uniref:Aminotransferase-like plant mobile domain-containing protein n=1 Tax=Stylosanthes scabra TaxID=79078 RepID=A0ABU6XHB2_9FABA|nr:hypothetical protein [Stylosanthes scabra]